MHKRFPKSYIKFRNIFYSLVSNERCSNIQIIFKDIARWLMLGRKGNELKKKCSRAGDLSRSIVTEKTYSWFYLRNFRLLAAEQVNEDEVSCLIAMMTSCNYCVQFNSIVSRQSSSHTQVFVPDFVSFLSTSL